MRGKFVHIVSILANRGNHSGHHFIVSPGCGVFFGQNSGSGRNTVILSTHFNIGLKSGALVDFASHLSRAHMCKSGPVPSQASVQPRDELAAVAVAASRHALAEQKYDVVMARYRRSTEEHATAKSFSQTRKGDVQRHRSKLRLCRVKIRQMAWHKRRPCVTVTEGILDRCSSSLIRALVRQNRALQAERRTGQELIGIQKETLNAQDAMMSAQETLTSALNALLLALRLWEVFHT